MNPKPEKTAPGAAAGPKRFFSLKWKALLLLSLVLLIVNASFPFISYVNLRKQFEDRRTQAGKQYALEFEGLLDQSAQRLFQLGGVIPSMKGMEEALAAVDRDAVIAAFENHWPLLQLDTGIETVRFYTNAGTELASWSTTGFTADRAALILRLVEAASTKEHPATFLWCRALCAQYVVVPILSDGTTVGAIVLGTTLADVIVSLQRISGVDIGVLIGKSGTEARLRDPARSIPLWNANVLALTHMENTLPFLKHFAEERPSIGAIKTGQQLHYQGADYELGVIPLAGLDDATPGYLVVIENISGPLSEIRSATKQGLMAGLLGLLLSEGLLLAILSRPMARLKHIAKTLPLLGEGAFQKVRSVAGTRQSAWAKDEIDVLGDTALALSYQLEKLEEEVKKRTKALSDRMSELASEKAFISNLLDTARVIILTQNRTGEIMTLNQHGRHLTGYDLSELSRTPFLHLLSKGDLFPNIPDELTHIALGQQEYLSHESVLICKDQSRRHIVWFHSRLSREEEDEAAILSVGLDFTERKQMELRLSWLADHDPLTGLLNRRRFQNEVKRILAEANRYNRTGALLLFDLDQFKYVNDTRGHHAGDALLKGVAGQISRLVRSTDFLCRLGGDEFALVIFESAQPGAIQVAEKIIEYLNEVEVPTLDHKVSASIGIALFPQHGKTVQKLLSNADLAMYQAKEEVPGSWHLFSGQEPIKDRMQKRIYWKDKIKRALDKDGFVLHYQPVQNVVTGSVYFHEALLRMRDEGGALVPPGAFIPIAEECGLIHAIDHLVLDKVITCQAAMARRGLETTFSINLSGHAFNDRQLLPYLHQSLKRNGADPKRLIFEITETAALSDLVSACNLMDEIKEIGFRFALDDFGTGFASFNYMKQLPVDYVKISETFIRELPSHPDDQIFVRSLSEITRGMGKKTVAEGVEDLGTLALLREYAVDFAQGFYLGKPGATIT